MTTKQIKRRKQRSDPKLSEVVARQHGYNVVEGDNAKINALSRRLFFLPDIDLHDVNQVNARIDEFFRIFEEYDLKPGTAALAMALNGHSRKWLLAVIHDDPSMLGTKDRIGNGYEKLPDATVDTLKKTHGYLELSMESNMMAGKINPVPAIFSLKNNFDWKDTVDYKVTNGNQEINADDLRKMYAIDAEVTDTPKKIK